MRQNRILTILILATMLCIIITGSAVAQEGPCVIMGRVHTSEGVIPDDGFEGTFAVVILEHEGARTTYIDPDGLEQDENGNYWYVVTIPEDGWGVGDTYWVQVDGTGWGDLNHTCVSHDNPDVNSWIKNGLGSEMQDVNTVNETIVINGVVPPSYLFIVGIAIITLVIIILAIVLLGRDKQFLKPPF